MTYDTSLRCPHCASPDVYGFERTPTGRSYYCPKCSEQWRVTVENRTLDMIGESLAARRPPTNDQ
jgi:DNA-directed RNA polymerase subunit RPC12/RpoP